MGRVHSMRERHMGLLIGLVLMMGYNPGCWFPRSRCSSRRTCFRTGRCCGDGARNTARGRGHGLLLDDDDLPLLR